MTPKSFRRRLSILALAVQSIAGLAQNSLTHSQTASKSAPLRAQVQYGNLPLSFEPNLGQTNSQVQWLARGPEYTLFLAGHDAVLELNSITPAKRDSTAKIRSSAVKMNLLGALAAGQTVPEDPLLGKSNYFTGRDPSKWQRNVPTYGKVRLNSVYPGVDLVYYGRQGQLEYDFVVAPGADPSVIRWGFDGAKPALAANGDLELPVDSAGREIRLNKPVVYQMKDGHRESVESSFAIAENKATFKLGAYDKSRELVIDPTLVFMGAIGTGNQQSVPNGLALDASNEIILTGITNDLAFPTTTGAYETSCQVPNGNGKAGRCGASSGSSAFVTKISADGKSLVYSTYLHGGDGYESGQSVAIDSSGNAVVLGSTSSEDFPVTTKTSDTLPGFQTLCMPYFVGGTSGIVQNCDGYFAGGGTEWVIGGPTLFIAKLSPDGSKIVYATFFGGTAQVYPEALALDSSDNMYFIGYNQAAWATDNVYPNNGNQNIQFPLTNSAFQGQSQGQPAATFSVLSADGQTLLYSTFLAATTGTDWDVPIAVAVGQNGIAAVGGVTSSAKFPTTSGSVRPACVPNPNSTGDCLAYTAFTTVFDTTQSGSASVVYSTYIGGSERQGSNTPQNQVFGLAFDASNDLFVTGTTSTIDYPTTKGAFQPTCNHANNANSCGAGFLSKIDPTGSTYLWSTYFGGTNSSYTEGHAITFDSRGWVYLYGYNNGYSWDLPVVNPIEALNGSNFPFVATFSANGRQLLFSTPVFESPNGNYGAYAIASNGFALDSDSNIYLAGYGNDGGKLPVTTGTYTTTATSSFNRGFFAKITKVLGPVATKLTVSPSPALPGSSITFTVSVAPTAETTPVPTGTVTLTNVNTTPATLIGTITLGAKGSGSFTTSKLVRGSYSVTANYSGDASYETGTSTAQTLAVNQFTPVVKVTPSELTIPANKPLTVTVDLAGPSGAPIPTGTVTLSSGKYVSASETLSAGAAKFVIPAGGLAGGRDELLCKFTPNAASLKTYLSGTGAKVVTVTKLSQTIRFTAPRTPVVYGVKPISLLASASSGLPITFKVLSGPGKVVKHTLEITGAGTVSVEATQPGDSDYDAAVAVKHSIVVDKARLTVSANDLTMTEKAKVPTLTYKMAGFVNGDRQSSSTRGAPKLSTTATSNSTPKGYPITITIGTLTSGSYTFTFKGGTLTVVQ